MPQRTPYDLAFRLFGIPIRVHPLFWLVGVLLGWNLVEAGFEYLFIFMACFFVSILIHELGHALLYRTYRIDSAIWLYGFGGLAVAEARPYRRIQRIIVSLAGPAAGFLFLGAIIWSDYATQWSRNNEYTAAAFLFLYFMNLYWNILNLIPIYPLDGGQVSRELLVSVSPSDGVKQSLYLSIILAIVLCVHGIMGANGQQLIPYLPNGGYFMAFLFGLLAFENYQYLSMLRYQDRHWSDGPSWR